MNIHSLVTVNRALLAPWCNRWVGPGVYEIPGDVTRFFRNVSDRKMLAYSHVVVKLVDLDAGKVEEAPAVPAPVIALAPVAEVQPEVQPQVTAKVEDPKIELPAKEEAKAEVKAEEPAKVPEASKKSKKQKVEETKEDAPPAE